MNRIACIDIREFPLQLLLRMHPDWRIGPAVVVEKDRPQARILWSNRHARDLRILPGLRYAQGLSLSGDLRAGVIDANDIQEGVRQAVHRLQEHTPNVEASKEVPGIFWLDASGFERLFPSLEAWGEGILDTLLQESLESNIVIGFGRFATYAVARAQRALRLDRVRVLSDAMQEQALLRRVPLEVLGLEPGLRDTLAQLDLRSVGAFLSLSPRAVAKRLGPAAARYHELALGAGVSPFRAAAHPIKRNIYRELDDVEASSDSLLSLLDEDLETLLQTLAGQGEATSELTFTLQFRQPLEGTAEALGQAAEVPAIEERIRPAAPTLDGPQLMNLIRLRLEAIVLPAEVVAIGLELVGRRATREQLQLFAQRQRRDLRAADRAIARIRAELGDDAVVRARLREAHLPEASFCWECLDRVKAPSPTVSSSRSLIRRIRQRPERLSSRSRRDPDGWLLRGAGHGHVIRQLGPYIISGGWWVSPVQREYYYAETRDGSIFWFYHDRPRKAWFVHGSVE